MSNWTHVAAIVRLNNMLLAMVNPQKLKTVNVMRELQNLDPIDPEMQARDDVMECFNTDVPGGSEGPLKIALYLWPTTEDFDKISGTTHLYKGSMYWGDVIISGDLRDFDEPEKVADWLKERTENLPNGVGVRGGTLLAHSELGKCYVMHNDGSGWVRYE